MLSGSSGSLLDIAAGSTLLFPGSLDSHNRNNSVVNIEQDGTLLIGEGGTTGDVKIPTVIDGQLAFYRSDMQLRLSTPISGLGEILFKGTGVNGQSSYDISLPANDFAGKVTVASGARLHLNPTEFVPRALFVVNNGGSLWLGSAANYSAPVTLQGLGWKESSGIQYGALRMDSNPVLSGSVLLTGDARMSAIFSDYTGTISGAITDNNNGYQLEKYGDGLIILSGNSNWTGGILLTDGTLSVSKDSNLGAARGTLVFNGGKLSMTDSFISQRALAVNISEGALLALDGFDQKINNLSGSGDVSLGGALLTLNNTVKTLFSGQINDDGSLTKTGSETLIFTGTISIRA